MAKEIRKLRLAEMSPWEPIPSELLKILPETFKEGQTDNLAHEIGRYMLMWSQLELNINYLLMKLAGGPDLLDFYSLLAGLDIYKKSDALMAMAARRKPNDRWFDEIKELHKRLSGPLREKRNRLVHDFWSSNEDQIQQITFKARHDKTTGRPQVLSVQPITTDEIAEGTAVLFLCGVLVKRLYDEYEATTIRR